ncbi:MAG TPA: BTAD domain-containing putative transcriptional regulator [Chloroflexia bacterium]|nr:BTAD domain-containing putative transcriptional regulator [Chloroflexia bacterium]
MFTILKSKLRPPAIRRDAIDRAPLLLRLDTAVAGAATSGKVLLVTAAAGYGKSTMLAAWAAHLSAQGTPIVWYNLSPGDRALPVFLAYLEAGLRTAVPGFAPAAPLVPSAAADPAPPAVDPVPAGDSVAVESLLTPLIGALEVALGGGLATFQPAQGRPRLLLVLDDLHYVAGHTAIETALTFLMRQLPAGLVLAITSRRELGAGLPLARLRSNRQVTAIGEQELRLLPSEIARAYPLLSKVSATRQAIPRLLERLDGWPMGFHILHELLADEHLAAEHADPAGVQLARRVTEELYTYLDEEALSTVGEPLYSFLLRTAVLDDLSVPAADAVTEMRGSEVLITQAQHQHLFLQRTQVEPAIYRYHELFGDFLRQRLGEMYGYEEKRRLHRLAAAQWAGVGSWVRAARQFLAAGDVDAALASVNVQREQAGEAESRPAADPPPPGPAAGPAPTNAAVGAALRNAGDPAARRRLVELLGLQAGAADIPLLEAFLADEDVAVQAAARATVSELVRRTAGVLRIALFGGFRIWRGAELVDEREWRRKRAKLLLVYLLLAGPDGASRQAIADKVWPDTLPGEANDQFYAHLRALRSVLEPALEKGGDSIHIKNQQGRYAFAFESPHHWDLAEFLRHRDQGRRAERLGRVAEAAAAYEAAVTIFTGDLLPESPFTDVTWLYNLRLACREDMISMRTFLAEREATQEHWEAALAHWKAILQVEPTREIIHARMMAAFAQLNRRDDALAQFQVCRAVLRRELGTEPLPSTVELYHQILSNTVEITS